MKMTGSGLQQGMPRVEVTCTKKEVVYLERRKTVRYRSTVLENRNREERANCRRGWEKGGEACHWEPLRPLSFFHLWLRDHWILLPYIKEHHPCRSKGCKLLTYFTLKNYKCIFYVKCFNISKIFRERLMYWKLRCLHPPGSGWQCSQANRPSRTASSPPREQSPAPYMSDTLN